MQRANVNHHPDPHSHLREHRSLPVLKVDTRHVDASSSSHLNVPTSATSRGSDMVGSLIEYTWSVGVM